jgi:ATP-dependent Lhr-like helicase
LDEFSYLLRILGALTILEVDVRSSVDEVSSALAELGSTRRAIEVRIGGEARWADPTDAPLLRDALGTALPPGIAESLLTAIDDPLGRLLGRYARTHGPFVAAEPATRFGLGVAVVTDALRRLTGSGRLAEGEFRPLGSTEVRGGDVGGGSEFVDAEVLRLLRRRSLAALRAEVEPVEKQALAKFLPAWNGIGIVRGSDSLRGTDGLLRAIEQLAGALVPASALESLILPARIAGYTPALLDELTTAGEVLWTGHGSLAGDDGWIALHLAETASLTIPLPAADAVRPAGPLHEAIVEVLAGGGAFFFRPLAQAVAQVLAARVPAQDGEQAPNTADSGPFDDPGVADALWDLVFAGIVTSDSLAPLRAKLTGGKTTHRSRTPAPRARMRGPSGLAMLSAGRNRGRPTSDAATGIRRGVPPSVVGRWSLVPEVETDVTVRTHAAAEVLLDRHGIVTRGAVVAEGTVGGFAAVYRVLAALEETGRIRRGYFIEGLGASQFASAGAVDRVRAFAARPGEDSDAPRGVVLAAADPANPYGAALPWPAAAGLSTADPSTANPSTANPGTANPGAADRRSAGRGSADPSSAGRGVADPRTADHGGDGAAGGVGGQGESAGGAGGAGTTSGVDRHRPARRAGALTVLVDGAAVLYAERGGRSLLSFTTDAAALEAAAEALAERVRSGRIGSLTITKLDGADAVSAAGPVVDALTTAGFTMTPRGLRLRNSTR